MKLREISLTLTLALVLGAVEQVGGGAAPAAAAVEVPFAPGEALVYRVEWAGAEAASARLEVRPGETLYGRKAWHFLARASTLKAARLLYPLDDQFDSYSEVAALASLRWEMYQRERGTQRNRIIRMNRAGEPVPADGPAVRVPAGTRDPLGLLYALRIHDWSKSRETRFPLFDGSKLYEVRAAAGAEAPVSVPAGRATARRVAVQLFLSKQEVTGMRFAVWIARDAARTPLLIEAELPLGKLRIALTSPRLAP
jgi:hypothetical protein